MENGLNGFFGRWLKKGLDYAVGLMQSYANANTGNLLKGFIDKMAEKATQLIEDNTQGSFFQRGMNPTEPTPQEEVILDQFVRKFTVFLKNIIIALDQATGQNPNIAAVNLQMAKMCIAKEYFISNETEGLSANAVQLRLRLINELFNPVNEIITDRMGALMPGNQKYVIANRNDFGNLFENDVNGQRYFCFQYPVSSSSTDNSGYVGGNPPKFPATPSNFNPSFPPIPGSIPPGANTVLNPSNNGFIKGDNVIDSGVLVAQTQPSKLDKTFKYVSYGLLAITAFGVVKPFFTKSKQ